MINGDQEDVYAISMAGWVLSMQHFEFFLLPSRWQEMTHSMDWNKVINAGWDRDASAMQSCWLQTQCLAAEATANV